MANIEILAPVGSEEMLHAAVFSGADAVYLGFSGFNARTGAGNFDADSLKEAVRFCHARGVKVHVALNTTVYGGELASLCDAIRAVAASGADAVICQVPGRDNTEGKIVLSEELDRVRMAIRELPERECMAIQLKFDLDRTDAEIAQLMGISVDRTITLTFAIGSALAAFASMFYGMTYVYIKPTTGAMPGIKAFTAAVFGGIGSIPGAFVGGILIGIIEAMAQAYISTSLANSIVFGVLIIVLLVKPAGLLGKYVPEKV